MVSIPSPIAGITWRGEGTPGETKLSELDFFFLVSDTAHVDVPTKRGTFTNPKSHRNTAASLT